jgi:hypothetical protein
MDRTTIEIDPTSARLRRVGRLARRRMRIDGDVLTNGRHTDGTVTIEISGLGAPVAGAPEIFEWKADRPIALVIVRSGLDGEEVAFHVGPSRRGVAQGAVVGDGSGIRYVAFCYDAPPASASATLPADEARHGIPARLAAAAVATVPTATSVRGLIAAAKALAPTRRERRSILASLLTRPLPRPATT